MAQRAVAEERRTIITVAENDADVPDALRLIANELDKKGGELLSLQVTVGAFDGAEQLAEPELDEDGNEAVPPQSTITRPTRLDIRLEAQIGAVIVEE